jgi:hypothetical protein
LKEEGVTAPYSTFFVKTRKQRVRTAKFSGKAWTFVTILL